jgi:ribosomal-protein-alanine N-acetyltransferase
MHKAIFTAPWDRTWSAESLARSLAMPGARAWLLERDGAPLGLALAVFTLEEGEVLLTGILPDARGRGHGRRLMRAVIDAARAAGVRKLFLEHAEANAAAERLYRSLGFAAVGRRASYYGSQPAGPRHDAVVLALDLAAPEPRPGARVDEGG